jgi:nitrite reductase (NADH) small subunit
MTEWTRVCRDEQVRSSGPVGCVVDVAAGAGVRGSRVCVARRRDGQVVAMLDRCPHRDIALSGGLVRDGILTCPGHFWQFELATGHRVDLPEDAVTLYPTRIVDGWVEVQLPLPAPRFPVRQWLLRQAAGTT